MACLHSFEFYFIIVLLRVRLVSLVLIKLSLQQHIAWVVLPWIIVVLK